MYSFEKIRIVTIKILVIVGVLILVGCGEMNPFRHSRNDNSHSMTAGTMFVQIHIINDGSIENPIDPKGEKEIERFVDYFSSYDLQIDALHYEKDTVITNIIYARISFNDSAINEDELKELFLDYEDMLVIPFCAELELFLTDTISVYLYENVINKTLEEFLHSYSKYDIRIEYHDEKENKISALFNKDIIDRISMSYKLSQDNRVIQTTFRPVPAWERGVFLVVLKPYVDYEIFEDFLFMYNEYELRLKYPDRDWQLSVYPDGFLTILRFNYDLVDEFEFLEIIKRDERVVFVEFNHYDISGGV